jgi:hypothetical protein
MKAIQKFVDRWAEVLQLQNQTLSAERVSAFNARNKALTTVLLIVARGVQHE